MTNGHDEAIGSRLRGAGVVSWLRLVRVEQKVARVLAEDLRRRGLNMAQFDTLAHVGAAEGLTQQELADALLVTKGNVCQVLDRMERRGLVLRRPEGRANRLFLTDEGRKLFEETIPPPRNPGRRTVLGALPNRTERTDEATRQTGPGFVNRKDDFCGY